MISSVVSYIDEHEPRWAFLALFAVPFVIAGTIAPVLAYMRNRRSDSLTESQVAAVMSKAVGSQLSRDRRLIFGPVGRLPLRVREANGDELANSVDHLYQCLQGGKVIRVWGTAGSGKSTLAAMLSEYSIQQTESCTDNESPIVVVLTVRNWRPALLRRAGRDRLHDWIVSELARSFLHISRPSLSRLFDSQKLIVCLDGLDELSEGNLRDLSHSLNTFVSTRPGAPLGVFGRRQQRGRTEDDHTGAISSIPSDRQYEVLPLKQSVVQELLADTSAQPSEPAPYELSRILNNPLTLSLAVEIFGDAVREKLGSSIDPYTDLWNAYIWSHIERTRRGRLGAVGMASLRGLDTDRFTFSVLDLLDHRLGRLVAFILCAAAGFLYFVDGGRPMYGILFILAFEAAVRPTKSWVHRIRRLIAFNRPLVSIAVLSVFAPVAYMVMSILWLICVRTRGAVVYISGLPTSLWKHLLEATAFKHWVHDIVVPTVYSVLRDWVQISLLGLILALLALGTYGSSNLGIREAFDALPLPRRLLDRFPVWSYGATIIFFVTSVTIYPRNIPGVIFLIFIVFPLLTIACSGLILWIGRWIDPVHLKAELAGLVNSSVLLKIGKTYRFRHPDIQEEAAYWAVTQLASQGKLRTLGVRPGACLIRDERMNPKVLEKTVQFLSHFAKEFPRHPDVGNSWAMIQAWGTGNWHAARDTLVNVRPRRAIQVQLAEVELELELTDVAYQTMKEAVDKEPKNYFELNRWARFHCRIESIQPLVDFFASDAEMAKTEFAKLLAIEIRREAAPSDASVLEGLLLSEDDNVRARAACLLASRSMTGDLSAAANLLATVIEEGPEDPYVIAQLAQVQGKRRRLTTAKLLAQYAYAYLMWTLDPRCQLFVLKTLKQFCPDCGSEVDDRIDRLEQHGWSDALSC